MSKSFYLTTTLPYVNAPLHLGHALEFVRADALARYQKLKGFDVYFNTGADEHGTKILEKAKEKGLSPKEFVDQGFLVFQEQLQNFGVNPDCHFIRTTDEKHEKAVKEFWIRVRDNGFIYKKNYQAKYCVGCESEKTDSELDAKGECPLHPGRKLELLEEENYFFKYSVFTDKLLALYDKNPTLVIPDFRFLEIKNFVKNGLQDFSISRLKSKMPWGIEVPNDPDQVIYVWFDALVNYLATLGWPTDMANFEKYWVNGTPTHYCGKDNLRFQSAMWQAMLLAADLPNSHQIIINGFITGDGGVRMSKTLGNVVDPRDIVRDYGVDALRYFLLREISSFEDSPFTLERFKEAYNANLANGLGNLTSRIMKMAETNLTEPIIGEKSDEDFPDQVSDFMTQFRLDLVMDYIWAKIAELDREIQDKKPWESKDKEVIEKLVLNLYQIGCLLKPFLPTTADKIIIATRDNKMPEPLFLRK